MTITHIFFAQLIIGIIVILCLIMLFIRTKQTNDSDIGDNIKRIILQQEALTRRIEEYMEKDYQRDLLQQQRFSEFKESVSKSNYEFSTQQARQFLGFSEKLGNLQNNVTEQLALYNERLTASLTTDFKALSESLEIRLNSIDAKVMENLQQGFNKTNETFSNILVRLSKIDDAQKKIEDLSGEIVSLQDVLTDKKSRGTFGEVQLYQILSAVFGEKNDRIYQMQYSLNNNTRVDAVLFTPEPLGTLAIDSKFPLENYRRMVDRQLSEPERNQAEKLFVSDCRKHIDAIAAKYIIAGTTADQAFLFLPAEAIFAEIHAYHPEIIEYASRKNVWLASPTTLMSTLTTIQTILMNIERNKYTKVIQEQLTQLNTEFSRYRTRWDNLSRHIETVSRDVQDINTTTEKITRRFETISNVKELPDISE